MDEKQLVEKIQILKNIKPRNEWVFLTKSIILEKEMPARKESNFDIIANMWQEFRFVLNHKYAFISLVALFAVVGTFGFALKSIPGDALFGLKKAMEQGQGVFTEKPKFNLEQANKRLEDLTKIVANNDSRKLAPAIDEYKASVSEVTKSLVNEKDAVKMKEIVSGVRDLENKEEEIKSLGVELGDNIDKDSSLVMIITKEVQSLEGKNLTKEQKNILLQIRADCESNNFSGALENLLLINSSL